MKKRGGATKESVQGDEGGKSSGAGRDRPGPTWGKAELRESSWDGPEYRKQITLNKTGSESKWKVMHWTQVSFTEGKTQDDKWRKPVNLINANQNIKQIKQM